MDNNQKEIVTEIIAKYNDSLEPDQIQALPLMGFGMSIKKVAKYIGVSPAKITMWLQTNPLFRSAIQEFRAAKDEYHHAMLNQVGAMAWDKVFKYLSDDDTDEKIQSDIAKFVISQLSLKTTRSEIKHEIDPQIHVTEDSAGLIAQKLRELQNDNSNTVDAEYRIALDDLPDDQDEYSGMKVARALDEFRGEDFDEEIDAAKDRSR